jgi:hypothetical protein
VDKIFNTGFNSRLKVMLLISNLFLLLVNAATLRREFTLFNRLAIFILLYSGIMGYDSLYITSR